MKEKWIREISSKTKGSGYMVEAKVMIDGRLKSINGGRFYTLDYDGDKKLTRTAAVQARNKLQEQINIGNFTVRNMTVEGCYKKSQKNKHITIKTIEREDSIFYHMMNDSLRNKSIQKVTAEDIQQCLNSYADGHSNDQIKRAHAIWKQIYRAALMSEIQVFDRSAMVLIPKSKKVVKKKDHSLTHKQFIQFSDELLKYNCENPKGRYRSTSLWYACQIMYYTGLRPQEVYALSEDDIDLDAMEIHVSQSVGSTTDSKRKIIPLKTEYSYSSIPITEALKPVLVDLLAWYKHNDQNIIFTDIDGLPYEISYVSNYISNVSKHCKTKYGFTFNQYELRHLFSKDLFDAGTNPKVIQSLMRHASENMSLYYAYTTEEDRANALKKRKV